MSKKHKSLLSLGLILLVLGLILYPKLKPILFVDEQEQGPRQGPGQRSLNVDVMVISPINLKEIILSSGTLLPDEQVDLSFETSGKIVQINFDEGTYVQRGDLLAKLNDRPLQAQLKKLDAQKSLVDDREFRQRTLLQRDAISQEAYDQIVTEQQSVQADMDLIKARIAETELRAPFSGIIGLRHVSEGSFVNQNHRIARLVKNNPLKIEFSIPERYAADIAPGQHVSFTIDGKADTLQARVYAVDPKIDIRTRTIMARAMFSNTQEQLKPGRFVSIVIEMNEIQDAIAIPTEALIPQMEGDRVFLYRNGQASSVLVETGLRTESKIQIREGLQVGDTVLTTGVLQLREGLPLQIDRFVHL